MFIKSHQLLLSLAICFTILFNLSCSTDATNFTATESFLWKDINGRSNTPIYRVKIPSTWQCQFTNETKLSDTTQPLCTLFIPNERLPTFPVVITIHNFPVDQLDKRIPPQAQISRWKNQFSFIDSLSIHIHSQAFNGFTGLMFEAYGTFENLKSLNLSTETLDLLSNNTQTMILGWALQVGSSHFRTLSLPKNAHETVLFEQMRSDVTIKVIGSKDLIEKYKDSIIAFARSLELINPI